jgi:hypothetical protein
VATDARLSQLVLEVLRTLTAVDTRLSQVVLEVLRVNGTEGPIVTTLPQPQTNVIT